MAQTAEKSVQKANYGLRREILSPMETLAQSVSTMAPTTTPAATIPLVCALAGNGTWLAYVLATAAVLLVALCIARYALPRYLRDRGAYHPGAQIVPWLAGLAMLLALVGNFYPVPEGPYGKLPYIYLAYLAAGLLWFAIRGRGQDTALTQA
jgi:hypothetical protein